MKILTIGNSPYNNNSCSKIHASIIKKMLMNKHEVSVSCWNYDTVYHYGENNEFYYEFNNVKVPVNPYKKDSNEVIFIYELIKTLEPDVIIGIGDVNDFYFMKAIKSFSEIDFKWILILTNHNYPILRDHEEVIPIADSVFCTSQVSCNSLMHLNKNVDWAYYGSSSEYNPNKTDNDKFNVCLLGLNTQIENIPSVIKSIDILSYMIPSLNFYLHTNLQDGDHDIYSLIKGKKYISMPENYISAIDDCSDNEFNEMFNKMDVIISASMVSAVGCSVLNAMACGVIPVLSNTKFHSEVINSLLNDSDLSLHKHDLLIDSIEIHAVNDYRLKIIKQESLIKNLYNIYINLNKLKQEACFISKFSKIHSRKNFLNKFNEFLIKTVKSSNVVYLETV